MSADPAKLGLLGAGVGAGAGLLGSAAFGTPGRRRPGYGALLGGLMGGAAMGGYGLLRDSSLLTPTPTEKKIELKEQVQGKVDTANELQKYNPLGGNVTPDAAKVPTTAPPTSAAGQAVDATLGAAGRTSDWLADSGAGRLANDLMPADHSAAGWAARGALGGLGADIAGNRLRSGLSAGSRVHDAVANNLVSNTGNVDVKDLAHLRPGQLRQGLGSGGLAAKDAVQAVAGVPAVPGSPLSPLGLGVPGTPAVKAVRGVPANPAVPQPIMKSLRQAGEKAHGGYGMAGTGLTGWKARTVMPTLGAAVGYGMGHLPQAADSAAIDAWNAGGPMRAEALKAKSLAAPSPVTPPPVGP